MIGIQTLAVPSVGLPSWLASASALGYTYRANERYDVGGVAVRDAERVVHVYEPSAPLGVAFVAVHGGGLTTRNPADGMASVGPWLALRGFHVFDVRYRLVTGDDAVVSRDCALDVAAAVAYALGRSDVDRVCLIAHSTGARLSQTVAWVAHYLGAYGLAPSDLGLLVSIDAPTTWDEVPRLADGTTWDAQPPRTTQAFTPSVQELHGDVRSSTPNDVGLPTLAGGSVYDRDRRLYGGRNAQGESVVAADGLGTHEHARDEPGAPPLIGTYTRNASDLRADTAAELASVVASHPRMTVDLYEGPVTTNHGQMLTDLASDSPMRQWLEARIDQRLSIVR